MPGLKGHFLGRCAQDAGHFQGAGTKPPRPMTIAISATLPYLSMGRHSVWKGYFPRIVALDGHVPAALL